MFASNKKSALDVLPVLYKETFSSLQKEFINDESSITIDNKQLVLNLCILSNFIIDYTITQTYKDDKKQSAKDDLMKISSYFFKEFLIGIHGSEFTYSDHSGEIKEKISLLKSRRSEVKPPQCWHLIYSDIFGSVSPDDVLSEIKKFEKGIAILNKYSNMGSLQNNSEEKLKELRNNYTSFDKSEMIFRQIIRESRKSILTVNVKKVNKNLKSLDNSK